MIDLTAYDLVERSTHATHEGEHRLELRVLSTGDFVAWFRTGFTTSKIGAQKFSSSVEFCVRETLTQEQIDAARAWLRASMQQWMHEI